MFRLIRLYELLFYGGRGVTHFVRSGVVGQKSHAIRLPGFAVSGPVHAGGIFRLGRGLLATGFTGGPDALLASIAVHDRARRAKPRPISQKQSADHLNVAWT